MSDFFKMTEHWFVATGKEFNPSRPATVLRPVLFKNQMLAFRSNSSAYGMFFPKQDWMIYRFNPGWFI